ncbi:hypothetical protein I4F81_000278 [Pyropia yezoensis]|uniref:Uncharacterized protein n=1 Tax=Pyropia yezoensis TaxID=2788 RepID=A0ACC3BIQ2_PYRYE|nr:hypothetical protein I4F81_000278 [Neopyropia yezoensis]
MCSMVPCLQAFVAPAGCVLSTSRVRRVLPRTCLPSGPASRLRGLPGRYGPRIPLTRRAYVARMDAGLSSGLSVPEAGISVVTTMAHTLQSVSTEATEKEKELEELQIDIKELLVELQAAAVQQLDSTVSDQAAVELAWQRDLASLRVDKSYIMGVLRDLYEDLDETFHAMSTSEMMAHGVLLVSTQITEKELQLEAVREQRKAVREHLNAVRAQLKAAASESDDRDPALVQPDQSGWDKARARRASQTYSVVQECLREDQQYIHDVLKFLRRMQNTLKTQERMQRLIRGPSPLHAEPVTDVARRLPHFIAPNPVYGKGLSKRRFGDNLVPAAVRKLYSFRRDARATGFVTGPPGRGKTLLLLLLLLSVIEEPDLVMSLTPEVLDWWASLPVYVLSFNGITKATVGDHVLAAIDLGLPGLLRIIYAESWDPRTTDYQFSTYLDDVTKMLIDGRTSVAAVKATATALVQARLLPASADGMRGLLLVDELPRLSLAALPKDEREALLTLRQRCKRGMDVLRLMYVTGEGAAGPAQAPISARTRLLTAFDHLPATSITTAATSTAGTWTAAAGAAASETAFASTSEVESTGRDAAPVTDAEVDDTVQPEDAALQTAEAVRKQICDWCEELRIRPLMTAFEERFAQRQGGRLTGSLSTVQEVVVIPLLPLEELRAQQRLRLLDLRVALRRSTATGQRRLLPVRTVASHLASLTLGHPRAAVVLDEALEGSSDGDIFFSTLLRALAPTNLSVAQRSIDILEQHPVVMAVGLLNYDAPSSGLLTEQLSWNMVFGVGALLQRSSGRSKARNPTIIVTFFLAALEARLQRSAIVGAATAAHDLLPASAKYGGRSEPAHSVVAADLDGEGEEDVHDDSVVATVYDISGDDGGVYAACNEVRRAVLVGDVPVAWENLFLWTEVLLSCCRALLCRSQAALHAPGPLPYGKYSLRKLYPAPDRLTGQALWLSQATVDASIACRGVVYFSSIPQLLEDYSEEDLLGHVWRPWSSTFPGIDGISFLRCVRGAKGGPRTGELVARAEQYKSGEQLVPNKDIFQSCSSLRGLFGPGLWKQWKRRTALIITARSKAPARLDLRTHKPAFAIESVIVMDVDSMDKAYGNTIATFAVCADSLFGTHVVSRPSLGQPPKKRRRRAST